MKTLYRVKHIVTFMFVASSLYFSVLRPSLAQGPIAEPTPTPGATPGSELAPISKPIRGDEIKVQDITWKELDYDDQTLTVGSPDTWIHFYVPGDQVFVPGSYTRLIVSHTGAQAEKSASLTVEFNDHVLDTIQLTLENDKHSQTQLDLPPEYLKTGRNTLQIALETAWDPCAPADELPVEAVLHSEGLFHLEYKLVPREPDLALYPVPFFEQGFGPSVTHFVLPDSPTSDDMTVAATISAGLGRYSAGKIQVKSATLSELTSEIRDNYNLILIGLPETNAFLAQLPLPLSLERASIADGYGVLQEITSPWNPRRVVLVVTGKTYEGVFKAGAALNRQVLFPSFKGPIVIVKELLAPPEDEVGTPGKDWTFEALGYEDTVMYGTRPTSERFYFYMPGSWQLSDNPSLKLFFTHSEILTNTMSTLDVRLNRVPIGNTLLDHSNSKDGLLELELPSWLLKSGENRIEVFVDMSTGIDECLYWTSSQAWTVISRNSTLHLPYEPRPAELDLANLFWPLTDKPNLSDTYIVLPETSNRVERDALLNLAAQLGASARGNYIVLQAGQAADLSSDLKQTRHIMVIGQPSTNLFIREVNDFLPQPFLPGSDEPSQVHNPAIITFDPKRSIGLVQLAASPWNPDKALLVVTGTDSEGVMAAFDLLLNSTEELKGNLAMIEDENLVTVDTRPLQVNRGDDALRTTQPSASVRAAQAERWW